MRFSCPHCHEPASRPVIKVGDKWVEDTDPDVNSGSVWCCSECHKPVVIEPQTPEKWRRVYEDHEGLTLLRKQTDRLASWILTNVPGEPSRDEGAIAVAIRLLESWRPKEMNESGY